jgi:hypothetical protein
VQTSKCVSVRRRCETAALRNTCQCKAKVKVTVTRVRQKNKKKRSFFLSFASISRPTFCRLRRFQHQYRIRFSIIILSLVNTGFFSLRFSFRYLSTPLVFFATLEFITLFNCVFWANRKPLDLLKGPSNLPVESHYWFLFHLLSLMTCFVFKLPSSI